MLSKLPFRSKLLVVASIPLLVLILVAGVALRDAYESIGAADDDVALFVPFRALTQVALASADERVGAAWYEHVADDGPPLADTLMLNTRDATDLAVDRLKASMAELPGRASPESQRAIDTVLRHLEGLYSAQARVNLHQDPGGVYQQVSESAIAAAELLLQDFNDRELATGARAVLDLQRSQIAFGDEARVVIERLAGDENTEVNAWVAAVNEQRSQAARFSEDANADQRAAFAATAASRPAGDPVRGDVVGELPTEMPEVGSTDPIVYADWYMKRQAALGSGTSAVIGSVAAAFEEQRSSIRDVSLQLAVGAVLAIALVIALSYVVARSVTDPLRALTRGAREMAERRLPRLVDTLRRGGELTSDQLEGFTPIEVQSRDEIGELAKAFNTVQHVTVAVAEQQAELLRKGIGDLYVNLARRNQSLLDRQIGLLDDIEARVEDPDELGALFELDHLATRMRRNAESLLVLSGAEQPRQWGTAVPVLDVARGAAAEIADFARVSYFGFDDDIAVTGHAVADVSHLLAELLENAAAFSPPTAPVVVAGRRIDRRFVVTITDEGIGMDDDRLAAANALLAHPPAPGLSLSRTLGLYVVAHLAARHGIHVQLRHAPGTGLTAVVGLPADVLARVDAPPPTRATPQATPMPAAPTVTYVAEPVETELVAQPAPVVAQAPPEYQPSVTTVAWSDAPIAAPTTAPASPPSAPPVSAPPVAPSGTPIAPPVRVPSGEPPLPRRAPGGGTTAGNGGTGEGSDRYLTPRTPGANLSQAPADRAAATPGATVTRPRPERVAELLSRHERGKREGHSRGPGDDR
jgi:signal transduction histidine kinase